MKNYELDHILEIAETTIIHIPPDVYEGQQRLEEISRMLRNQWRVQREQDLPFTAGVEFWWGLQQHKP